jgi:hypothetical protein
LRKNRSGAIAIEGWQAQSKSVKNKPKVVPFEFSEAWTRADDYIVAMARRRTARKAREPRPRTQPETPRFLLSTLPFLIVMVGLFVITIGFVVAAWPGGSPQAQVQAQVQAQGHELGTAPRGWFQKAERDFHRQAR